MPVQIDEVPSAERERLLGPLLDHLAATLPAGATGWQGWRVVPVLGGANNRLYRATRAGTDLAVKFTVRDTRDRAGREYGALLALQRAGLDLAPRPVLLERARYAQPVVVQGWLTGTVTEEPPSLDDDWNALVEHFAAIHTLTPDRIALSLPTANLTMRSAVEGWDRIREQLARIPGEAQPLDLQALVARVEGATFPTWPPPQTTLCRCDPNTSNFLRRDGGWASVDWENSGWGDPAFELADLVTHPKYSSVPPRRWAWVLERYVALRPDSTLATRVRTYIPLQFAWFTVRFARSLYEVPRGLDQRLVARSQHWQATIEAQYDVYLRRAHAALADLVRDRPPY